MPSCLDTGGMSTDVLNFFIRKAAYDQKVFELTTPSAYLEKHYKCTDPFSQPFELG